MAGNNYLFRLEHIKENPHLCLPGGTQKMWIMNCYIFGLLNPNSENEKRRIKYLLLN